MKALVMDAEAVYNVLDRLCNARSVCQAVAHFAQDNEPEGGTAAVAAEYLAQIVADYQQAIDQAGIAEDWTQTAEGGAGA